MLIISRLYTCRNVTSCAKCTRKYDCSVLLWIREEHGGLSWLLLWIEDERWLSVMVIALCVTSV
jgi:hypothetical protein